jgi:hypothetical protein
MVPMAKYCGFTKRMNFTSKESASLVQYAAGALMLVIQELHAVFRVTLPRVCMQPSKPALRVADD